MARTVAHTIREITRNHLVNNNGMLLGQCITAVGWVQDTVPPNVPGILELPMNDISGPGTAIGAAIVGERPIFVLRFQSFLLLAASPLLNHAAKCKEMFGYAAPVFIRAIATEGELGGAVHTNCYHSIYAHFPGMPVFAPMTPKEYEFAWNYYMTHDDPVLVSEHRSCYLTTEEMPDLVRADADVTIYAISATRITAVEAVKELEKQGIKSNLVHIHQLKPFGLEPKLIEPLLLSKCGIVMDSSFEIASIAEHIAHKLMLSTGFPVEVLGQYDKTPGLGDQYYNGTPRVPRMIERVKEVLERKAKPYWS